MLVGNFWVLAVLFPWWGDQFFFFLTLPYRAFFRRMAANSRVPPPFLQLCWGRGFLFFAPRPRPTLVDFGFLAWWLDRSWILLFPGKDSHKVDHALLDVLSLASFPPTIMHFRKEAYEALDSPVIHFSPRSVLSKMLLPGVFPRRTNLFYVPYAFELKCPSPGTRFGCPPLSPFVSGLILAFLSPFCAIPPHALPFYFLPSIPAMS